MLAKTVGPSSMELTVPEYLQEWQVRKCLAELSESKVIVGLITVWFDGGYDGSGYGSWEVECDPYSKRSLMERYGDWTTGVTSNVAEYLAFLSALKYLQCIPDKQNYRVVIWSDSTLVVNQVKGRWKIHKPHLRPLVEQARALLKDFNGYTISWHRRHNNVRRFGH